MAITDAEAARKMAELHPDLHQSRQTAFGENYIQDIEQGTGTAQYYSGFGLAPDWVTGAIGTPATTPVVQEPTAGDAQVAEQIAAQDRSASAVQPTTVSDPFLASGAAGGARLPPMDQAGAVAAMTPDAAYSLPGQSDPFLASGAAGGARLPATQATTTLPSGDVFAANDPTVLEKMDYTPTAESQSAWEKVQSGLGDIGDFIKTHGQTAANFFMNAVQPGLGLAAQMLPQQSPIDQFNREYALGGDLYENVVSQVDDPKFKGRLEGYADDLIAGTGEGKDPFGINTVSQFGDYPKYATDTYNKIIEKEKAGKELSQFDKDRLDYYGHVSGLTGKTNIPGTPLMVGDPVYGDYDEDITPLAKPDIDEGFQTRFTAKDDGRWAGPGEISGVAGTTIVDPGTYMGSTVEGGAALRGKIDRTQPTAPVTGVEGPPSILSPEVYQDPIMGIADDRRALQQELEAYRDPILDMEPAESVDLGNPLGDDRIVSEEQGSEGYPWLGYEDPIMGMVDEDLIDRAGTDPRIVPEEEGLIADKQMAMEFERQQIAQQEEMERAARAREEAAVRASLEAAQRAEAEQRARAREEAAQREREAAAEKAAAEKAAAQKAAAAAAAAQAASRHVGTGDKGTHSTQGSSGGGYSRGDYGGRGHHWAKGGRVRYGNGGIVDLL